MSRSAKKNAPDIVYREGKPVAVILDIDAYQELLERLGDKQDLKMLEEIRKTPLKSRKLEDFLKEHHALV